MPYLMYDPKERGTYWPLPTAKTEYDYKENLWPRKAVALSHGTTSAGYLSEIVEEPFMMLSEVPYLSASITQDTSPSWQTTRGSALENLVGQKQILENTTYYLNRLESRLACNQDPGAARIARSLAWWCFEVGPQYIDELESQSGFSHLLSKAERYSQIQRWDYYHTSYFLGGAHHLAWLLGERGMANDLRDIVEQRIMNIDRVSPLKVNPIASLVGAQALSAIAAMQYGHFGFDSDTTELY